MMSLTRHRRDEFVIVQLKSSEPFSLQLSEELNWEIVKINNLIGIFGRGRKISRKNENG
jgi:hypothetical protein